MWVQGAWVWVPAFPRSVGRPLPLGAHGVSPARRAVSSRLAGRPFSLGPSFLLTHPFSRGRSRKSLDCTPMTRLYTDRRPSAPFPDPSGPQPGNRSLGPLPPSHSGLPTPGEEPATCPGAQVTRFCPSLPLLHLLSPIKHPVLPAPPPKRTPACPQLSSPLQRLVQPRPSCPRRLGRLFSPLPATATMIFKQCTSPESLSFSNPLLGSCGT